MRDAERLLGALKLLNLQFLRKIFATYRDKKTHFIVNILYLWHLIQWVLWDSVLYLTGYQRANVTEYNIKIK